MEQKATRNKHRKDPGNNYLSQPPQKKQEEVVMGLPTHYNNEYGGRLPIGSMKARKQ